MSFLACGLDVVYFHGPCWMPRVSFDPPEVKMSSPVELTASVTKVWANGLPPSPKTALAQSSPATSGSLTAFPSSSNGPAGRFPVPPPGGEPKMSRGTTALTVTEAVAPAGRLELVAVRKSPTLMLVVAKVEESTFQVSRSGSGSWSVTTTLVAGPAPSFVTVMVNEAVSPGSITLKPLVTAFTITRCGIRVTLADDWALMMLENAPRFWASVKATSALLTSGVGSPA